jgi:hypothetical protein
MTTATTAIEADRQPYDVYARLEDPMGVLSIALGQWEDRDDTKPQPEVRRAANTAMDEIDRMLRELRAMRSRLVGEIRTSDDAAAVRADAMLAAAKAASV